VVILPPQAVEYIPKMPELRSAQISVLLEIFPRIFPDSRGYFFESFRQDWLQKKGVGVGWSQDWQVDEPIISDKDKLWLTLGEFKAQSGGGL